MNPILLKYLEEVAKVKAEVAAKQEKREQNLLKKKFAKPVGIYYEDGEPCLNLPDSPEKPDQSDCCNNGCTPCVFDVYSGELRDHQELVEQLKLDFESCCSSRDGSDTSSVASERLQRLAAADDRPLTSKAYRPFRVEEIHHVSAKLVVVVGRVPCAKDETERALGVKDGEHVLLRASYMGNIITKAFTPISHPDTKGTFKIMIKSYPNTAMSKYFRSLSIGDSIHLRGPIHSGYSYVPNTAARLIMLAAGSGIAPMYQILMKLRDHRSDDMTRLDLVYSNSTEEDVWLREELEILAKELDVLRVYHVITRPPQPLSQSTLVSPTSYTHLIPSVGRLDTVLLAKLLPSASDLADSLYRILICGPASFNHNMTNYMREMGYREEAVFVFK